MDGVRSEALSAFHVRRASLLFRAAVKDRTSRLRLSSKGTKPGPAWRPLPVFERTSMKISVLAGAAAVAVLGLAACSSDKTGDCPTITGITDASIATTFRPGATPGPSNVIYTAELTAVKANCDLGKLERTSDASLDLSFRATRPPGGGEGHYSVPYFVVVTEARRILIKRNYTIRFDFAPGQTVATANDTVDSVHLEVAKDKHPYDYQVLVGLQLTKAQLDYNRRTAHYGS